MILKKSKKNQSIQVIQPTSTGPVVTFPNRKRRGPDRGPERRPEARDRTDVAEARSLALGYLRRFSASSDNVEKARLLALLQQLVRKYGDALGADILGQIRSAKAEMGTITPARGPIWSEQPPESGVPIVDRPDTTNDRPDTSNLPPELQELLDRMAQIDDKLKLKGKGKKAAKQIWRNVRIYSGDVNRAKGHASQKILEEGATGAFGHSRQVGPDAYGAFGGSRMMSPDMGPSEFAPISSMSDPYGGMPMDPYAGMPLDANGYPMMMPAGYDAAYGYGSSVGYGAPFPTNFAPDIDYTAFATGNYLAPDTPIAYSNLPSSNYLLPEYPMLPESSVTGPPPNPAFGAPPPSWMDFPPPGPMSTSNTYTPEFDMMSFLPDYSGASIDSEPDLSGVDLEEASNLVGEQLSHCSRLIRALEASLRELEAQAKGPNSGDAAARVAGARYLLTVAKQHTNRALMDFEPLADEGISGLGALGSRALRALGGGPMLVGSIAVLYAGTLLADRVTGSLGNVAQGLGNGLKLGLGVGLPILAAAWLAKKFKIFGGRR